MIGLPGPTLTHAERTARAEPGMIVAAIGLLNTVGIQGTTRVAIGDRAGYSPTVAQIHMIYCKNTTGFEIRVSSNIPFLNIKSEQGPKGDRWENTLWLDSERVQPGDFSGTIVVETNDPEVPKLEVTVSGVLLDK